MTVDDLTTTRRDQVIASTTAVALLTKLSELHGELTVHKAGGICAGSDPMCHPVGGFRVGVHDAVFGEIRLPDPLPAVTVWVAADLYARWQDCVLVLDVVDGRGSGFSLEAPEGVRFAFRSEI